MSDVLSDVLRQVRLSGALFLSGEFSAPWAITTPSDGRLCQGYLPEAEQVMLFHLVVSGGCVIERDGAETVYAAAGTAIIFPRGDAHRLASASGLPAVPIAALLASRQRSGDVIVLRSGGGGAQTRIHCGFLACDPLLAQPLLRALPDLLIVDVDDGTLPWLRPALDFSAATSAAPTHGSAAVLAKLAELLFVEAVRRCVQGMADGQSGWLAAVRDAVVGRALAAIHGEPARNWSLEALAREAGASKTVLSERFTALLERSPMSYLTYWRLQLAAQRLRECDRPVDAIAAEVGYESTPAFTRAFGRQFGAPPARWRRQRRSARH